MENFNNSLDKLLEQKNLTFNESKAAMDDIMSGKISGAKLSSWLTALKIKKETSDEIAGCVSSMMKHAVKIYPKDKNSIDIVGTGGDTKNTINVSTASAITAAAAGLTVAKHGNKAVSSKSGSADVLNALNVKIHLSPEQIKQCLDSIGICFLFAQIFHPAMKYAAPIRNELGFRTIFNILGPLCNPAGIKRSVVGVYSPHLCKIIAESAKNLGFDHLLVVHGRDGLDEISITEKTLICELKDNIIKEYEFDPKKYGFPPAQIKDITGSTPKNNARTIEGIFNNKITGPIKDIIVLNTAAALIVGNKSDNWDNAIYLADKTITEGKASTKLNELINYTNRL